jgi:phage terminase large subunit
MGLSRFYDVQGTGIFGSNGTEILFAGIKTDPGKIKSFEGPTICIVEEAERISKASWDMLIPTIRGKDDSETEIWICFNPRNEEDETYEKFVKSIPFNARRVKVNWYDNPWFPPDLDLERRSLIYKINHALNDEDRNQSQSDYDHIWEGECQKNTNATIFRKRVVIEDFPPPPNDMRHYFGADWGFAVDPTALIRFFITTNADRSEELWIEHEAFGYGTEIDNIPALFDKIPGARKWPIHGDSSRPETISYVARQGFHLTAAEKWPGSLEDGVEHIKGFVKIHIHERCKNVQQEARLYSYKVDKNNGDVLPIIVDAWNHGWDAIRYGLDGVIQRRGAAAMWARLAKPTLDPPPPPTPE